jgi:ketosteroid isomerase-like protein
MEAINAIFHLADLAGVLSSLRASAIRHIVSLYIDDLVVFIDPTALDLTVVRAIMEMFADASSLRTNVGKC